jgi:hypothetical protein
VANQTREFKNGGDDKINNPTLDSFVLQAVMRLTVERKLMVGVRDRKRWDGWKDSAGTGSAHGVGVTFGRHPSSVSSKSNVPYQKHVKSLGTVHAVGPTFLLAARAKESGSFSISSTTRCPGEQVIECAGVLGGYV